MRCRALLFPFLWPVMLAAQARHPLLGSVVDAQGHAAVEAKVHFCSTAGEGDAFAPRDDLDVVTDKKGRFRVDLLRGRDYSAAAVSAAAAADGSRHVSRVYEDLAPGAPVEFALTSTARGRTLVVGNAAAWASGCGPLTLRIGPYARSFAGEVLPVVDGKVAVPPIAGTTQYCELLDADGSVLHRASLAPTAAEMTVPPPQTIPVLAVDAEGQPLAGVEVLHQVAAFQSPDTSLSRWPWRRQFRRGAVTAADGTAVVQVPLRESPLQSDRLALSLLARKAGFAEAQSGWDAMPYEDFKEVPVPVTRLRFVLHAEQPLRGQVLDADGAPVAGACVSIAATLTTAVNDMHPEHQRDWLVRTDAQGRFACGLLPAEARLERVAVAPTAKGDSVFVPEFAAPHPEGLGPVRELTLAARLTRRFPLRVVTVDGTPAAHALVQLLPVCRREFVDPWPFQARLDSAGRATLQIRDGEWIACATDGIGFAFVALDEQTPTAAIDLRLEPLVVCTGLVVDAEGRPVAGARFSVGSLGYAGDGASPPRGLQDRVLDQVAMALALASVGAAESDGDGQFRVRLLGRGDHFHVNCTASCGGRLSPRFNIEAAATPLRVELGRGQ